MWCEQLKNGKVRYAERYEDYVTGKTKKVSIVMDKNTRQNRKLALQTLTAKIDSHLSAAYTSKKKYSLRELIEAYRADQKQTVKQSTYTRNYFACNTLMDMLGEEVLIDRLTARYIRDKFLASGKKESTLNEHLARFRALIRWGYKNDFIADISFLEKVEPFKEKTPHKERIQDKYLESNELKTLLKNMNVPIWKMITEFLVLSGLRFGEAAALNRNDVDIENRLIHISKTYDTVNHIVSTPKTLCSCRDVYMQDELIDICRKLKVYMLKQRLEYGYRSSGLFLESPDGDFIHYYTYNKYLKTMTRKLLDKELTVHALRHTHASLLLENGTPIDTISRRLGHEDSKVTKEIYLHITEKLKEKDNEQIASVHIL